MLILIIVLILCLIALDITSLNLTSFIIFRFDSVYKAQSATMRLFLIVFGTLLLFYQSMMNLLGFPMLVLKIYIGMSPSPEHIISMMNCFNSGLWSPE